MSECYAHDIAVRQAWVPLLSSKASKRILLIERNARMDLYKEVDRKIKTLYVKTLADANQELEIVVIKGFGPTRRAKDQLNTDQVLAEAAAVVVAEMFGDW